MGRKSAKSAKNVRTNLITSFAIAIAVTVVDTLMFQLFEKGTRLD